MGSGDHSEIIVSAFVTLIMYVMFTIIRKVLKIFEENTIRNYSLKYVNPIICFKEYGYANIILYNHLLNHDTHAFY